MKALKLWLICWSHSINSKTDVVTRYLKVTPQISFTPESAVVTCFRYKVCELQHFDSLSNVESCSFFYIIKACEFSMLPSYSWHAWDALNRYITGGWLFVHVHGRFEPQQSYDVHTEYRQYWALSDASAVGKILAALYLVFGSVICASCACRPKSWKKKSAHENGLPSPPRALSRTHHQ